MFLVLPYWFSEDLHHPAEEVVVEVHHHVVEVDEVRLQDVDHQDADPHHQEGTSHIYKQNDSESFDSFQKFQTSISIIQSKTKKINVP